MSFHSGFDSGLDEDLVEDTPDSGEDESRKPPSEVDSKKKLGCNLKTMERWRKGWHRKPLSRMELQRLAQGVEDVLEDLDFSNGD